MSSLFESQNQERLCKKLDLTNHLQSLQNLFARQKSIILSGDTKLHLKYINALDGVTLPTLPEVPNLDDAIIRLKKFATLNLDEIYYFVQIVEFFNRLKASSLPPIWVDLVAKIEIPNDILEVVGYFNEDGELDPAKVEELFAIKEALKEIKVSKKDRLNRILNSNKIQEYLVDKSIHLYYNQEALLVRGGFSRAISANIIGRSSGGYFYIVPNSLKELEDRESKLLDREQEIYQIYAKKFSNTFREWIRFLEFINREFDRVDHYQARAKMVQRGDLNLILPNRGKEIILSEFAHPALNNPTPIDIEFNRHIMLVTGVNAGGKTMLLKSLLGAVFMSRYLIPFRCNPHKTKVGSFENIELILDDPQSVKNDISTFAGRIKEFNSLFKLKDAIVGVDEIELGTDADEAAALFRVLLEELSKRGLYFIVTTHHKRLASLMANDENVELVAAVYDKERQMPTYTYLKGSIGKSYAFETAQRYGIPEHLINKAREYLGKDKEQLSQLIEKSTELEMQMREATKRAKEQLERAKLKEQKIDALKERLLKEQKELLQEYEFKYQKALKLLKDALKEAENPEARRLINKAHKAKEGIKPKEEPKSYKFNEGDRVEFKGKEAFIISLKSKEAQIEVNGMKLRVPISQLKPLKEVKTKIKIPKRVDVNIQKPHSSKISLKLLGMRADEAIEETQKFISDALLHGFSEIEIIHGTGTGVLAKVITDLLKKHPRVKSFERVKGNLGATIIKL